MTASDLPAIPVRDVRDGGPAAPRDGGARRRARCATIASRGFRRRRGTSMPVLDAITRRWLMRSHSPYVGEIAAICGGARFLRHLVPQRLLPMGLHVRWRATTTRRGWCARSTGRFPASAAMSRSPAWRAGRRVLQRDLAGLCRRADRHGAGPLRGVDQPGAAVAAHAASVAAAARHAGERARDLAAAAHAAGPVAAAGVRDLRRLRERAGSGSRRRRSRGR